LERPHLQAGLFAEATLFAHNFNSFQLNRRNLAAARWRISAFAHLTPQALLQQALLPQAFLQLTQGETR